MKTPEIQNQVNKPKIYRFFEILPGLVSLSVLALPFVLSLVSTSIASIYVIAFLLLWFSKALGMNVRALQGWHVMQAQLKLDWHKMLGDVENKKCSYGKAPDWHQHNIDRMNDFGWHVKPSEVIHAVIIATHNESKEVVEPTIQAVKNLNFDSSKVLLIIAYEERAGEWKSVETEDLAKKYKSGFMDVIAIKHPKDIPGEMKGKGGNITYAGRFLKDYLEQKNIDLKRVLVTTLDADNRPHPLYLAALTYTFCVTNEPKYVSYQPIPMFTNNIWDAPAPMRVIATGNSFWMIVQSLRPHMLRNFSSHAQPMEALVATDFWSVRTIVEDGHQFWRSYFALDGKHDVYPIYVPIYQDAVLAENYRKTFKEQFIQLRRWAWGVTDVSYVAYFGFFKKNKINKWDLTAKFLRLFESHVSWATAPIILAISAFIPLYINPSSRTSFLANQLPLFASKLQTIAMLGILVTLFLSFKSLPPKPAHYRRHRSIWMVLQWVYLPFTSIFYSSFAAIYSQTRLVLGKYYGSFDATVKSTKKH